jgi:hypothetical protein
MRWLASTCFFLGACHLAESSEPQTCPPGSHPESGRCALDPVDGPIVTIASCVATPDSITVAPNAEFQFKNEDAVDRTITGDDGTVWATVKARQESPILGITKVGTWRYRISDCPKGGAIVVQ